VIVQLRTATISDLPHIKRVDEACFPPDDPDREPPAPDEIENGVANERVTVACTDDEIVGFIHLERPTDRHLYISGLGVLPDQRGCGVASRLLDGLLEEVRADSPASDQALWTVVSPNNLPMLGLLFSRGFVAQKYMADYFGPGRNRLYLQLKTKREYFDPDSCYLIPTRAFHRVESLLTTDGYAITAVAKLPDGPAFEVTRFEADDVSSLQSDESAAGVAFSSGVLAAITFVLGFSFASARYPDAVRVLLIAAAVATTMSLIIYANTSGELARLRSNLFGFHMKWGNALSEYGGVLPFLISLPVTFGQISRSFWAAVVLAVACSAAMLIYDRSPFSISERFARNAFTTTCSTLTGIAPVTGVFAISYGAIGTWTWAVVVIACLSLQGTYYAVRRPLESGKSVWPTRWQTRR
jgi:ribosomal protein S18 acetylase RimI-like enzyme